MKIKLSIILFLTAILAVISQACAPVSEFTATATSEPVPTSTPAPPTPTPTPDIPLSTSGNPIAVEAGGLRLTSERFEHPRGFVSFNVMDGWKVEYNDFSVSMTNPNSGVTYKITAINTGYKLSDDAYANFRKANERTYHLAEGYKEIDSGGNPVINLYYVEKFYKGFDGSEMYASSLYQQFDSVIFIIELIGRSEFVQADSANPYKIMFDSFGQTIIVNSKTVSRFKLYEQKITYLDSDINASLIVPWSWMFFADQSDDLKYANFYSPDFAAYAQFMQQDTEKLTRELGLDYAVAYLNIVHSNGNNDVQINNFGGFEQLEEGLYFFDWESKGAGKVGLLKYDIRVPNKLIIIVTVVQNLDFLPLYANVLGEISDSYQLEK